MQGSCLDVGAILGRFAQRAGCAALSIEQRRAVEDLSACRTAQLGGRIEECSCCGTREYLYNSCRNRHCPKCQAGCRAEWLDREAGHLLPVEYHHLVFTLPAEVAELARDNPRLIYGLLFEAASAAVREVAADPRHLGAQVGLTAVLHTWGQTLSLHPHLHVMATGGGLSCDRRGEIDEPAVWKSCRRGFFLPVRVLSALFKGKFLAGLCRARGQGELRFGGSAVTLNDPAAWSSWLAVQRGRDWVVYSQPPCAGAEVVLKYLARYTYRVAISNGRLLSVSDEGVTFSYKDYRREGRQRQMTLSLEEFARRFLQHVLPRGFVRVRHYGLLANRGRQEKLRACRRLLLAEPARARQAADNEEQPRRCPVCGEGQMLVVETIGRQPTARPQEQDLDPLSLEILGQLHRLVVAPRRQHIAVRAEGDGPHRFGMALEGGPLLARPHVAQPHCLVAAPRRQHLAVRAERNGQHFIGVALERGPDIASLHVPQPHRLVAAPRRQRLAVRAEGDGEHKVSVALEGGQFLPRLCIPQFHRLVIAP